MEMTQPDPDKPSPEPGDRDAPVAKSKSRLRQVITVVLMAAIFGYMAVRIHSHWIEVRAQAKFISKTKFVIAAFLFAFFLFAFRSLVWRRILKRFGYRIPLAPAVRIWSSSELARYIPGAIMQVSGRVYLVKPYGVPGSVCAASQMLELVTFLMANLLLGFGCLAAFGIRHIGDGARGWMYILALLVPLLALVLHPRIFYGLTNRIMARLKKPPIIKRVSGQELTRLLLWNIAGLLVQSVAVFLIVADPLQLHWDKWYAVTGAYSLAWCAGFLVVTSPAGLGVREVVFVGIMLVVLPKSLQQQFASQKGALKGFLLFLGALLRLWTIAGELILSSFAHLFDHRAVLGRAPELQKNRAIADRSAAAPSVTM
jgi:uncharacterized membrane protein YbhN (UPF0104 family)